MPPLAATFANAFAVLTGPHADLSSAAVAVHALITNAAAMGLSAAVARASGDENLAVGRFENSLELLRPATRDSSLPEGAYVEVLQLASRLALEAGRVAEAREFARRALHLCPELEQDEAWCLLRTVSLWPDAWLVAAIRREPPDEVCLDELAERHWQPLYARCRILAADPHLASDLAQDTWRRVLRVRHLLKPGGNFPGYLSTIASNIWRDWHRAQRRAGALGKNQISSLEEVYPSASGDATTLADRVPDLAGLESRDRDQLLRAVDHALARLDPLLREVVVSRFLDGQSCAEIGRRHHRTEQTVSAWVRRAVAELRASLEDSCQRSRRGVVP